MGRVTEALEITARAGFYVVSRALAFGAVGLLLNLALQPLLWPEISPYLTMHLGDLHMPHAGAAAGALVLVSWLVRALPGILIAATFLIGFPVVYVLMGKKHGVQVAMTTYLKDRKGQLILLFLGRLFEAIKRRPEWVAKIQRSGGLTALHEIIPVYLDKLENMPRPLRYVIRAALDRANFDGMLGVLAEAKELDELDIERISPASLRRLGDFIDDRFFAPSLKPLCALMAANLTICALVKFLL